MNIEHAIGIVVAAAGLLSPAAFAQSTTYSDIPKAFGAASPGTVFQTPSASSGFETSWLHLRESHGVGLPAPKSDQTIVVGGANCSTQHAGIYESSWLNLRETHGVGAKPSERVVASATADTKC